MKKNRDYLDDDALDVVGLSGLESADKRVTQLGRGLRCQSEEKTGLLTMELNYLIDEDGVPVLILCIFCFFKYLRGSSADDVAVERGGSTAPQV